MSESNPNSIPYRVQDIAGRRFGRLVVVGFSHKAASYYHWHCLCDCGKSCTSTSHAMKGGRTTSCGCAQLEAATTHGMTATPEHASWSSMKNRCHSPTSKDWERYGGRGIRVCDRWRESFEAFYADMGDRPKGTTLDRRDVNGDYEPGNCRWSTPKRQQRNRRVNVMLTHNGETHCLSEWAEIIGITRHMINYRMRVKGMTSAEQILRPTKKYHRRG